VRVGLKKLKLPPETIRHYEGGVERNRLGIGGGYLELIRTQEIVKRFLPKRRLDVVDVGGGPGVYSRWLAELGHNVRLVDPIPYHIKQARAAAQDGSRELFSVESGDARCLNLPDGSVDVVLMMGPLYHLTRRQGRIQSLREARRVLRPKGLLFAAAISRYASLIDGLKYGFVDDPVFQGILERDLREGQHRNPTGAKDYFTTSFFHHPNELAQEIGESGFRLEGIYAVEGPAEILYRNRLSKILRQEEPRRRVLRLIAAVETEPSLLGVSSHMLAVATTSTRRSGK
jgi:ubiquinone/menaquinone biosynthesis C-methylase UbiE